MTKRDMTKTLCVCLMLAGAGMCLRSRDDHERIVAHRLLDELPAVVAGGWVGQKQDIDPREIEVLGQGDFAELVYSRAATPPVDVFVAYFPTQRTGTSIHSPKNCLPGSGWSPLSAEKMPINLADGRAHAVNRYIVQKGEDRELVLYWYQAHNRIVASEYAAKFYLIKDSIVMNRSDGALVRIVTPIAAGEGWQQAQNRAVHFAQSLSSVLPEYIPA